MTFSAASLHAVLEAHAPLEAAAFVVAVSGGADSACLLTALSQLGPAIRGLPVRAVHVDHGLQPAAADFRDACERLCRQLKVPLRTVSVNVLPRTGESIEAVARVARYRAFAQDLADGECLLTAHHAQDQAETVLLQLLRGAGLKGLSAMPMCRAWKRGWHLRPLLNVARRDLHDFGEKAGIAALHDPMNVDNRFDRAYLRRQLWPLIEDRWPGAAIALSRSAEHIAEAQESLDYSAALARQTLRDGAALSVTRLRALSGPEQRNAVRYWIASQAATLPSTARLSEALRQVLDASEDHLPAVIWGEHALRRYRDRLFLTMAQPPRVGEPREWRVVPGEDLDLGRGLGRLQWSTRMGGLNPQRLPAVLSVRQRRGGETLRIHRRGKTQMVQHLCQVAGVLPWMRDGLPMVYAGTELIAVGDLWTNAGWCVAAGASGVGCNWKNAPVLT